MKNRSCYLDVPTFFRLDAACRPLVDAFGHSVYLVGSCLERPDFRDVDVSLMLPDEQFAAMFPNQYALLFLNACVSDWLKERTGLSIDFKFQDNTVANAEHQGKRNPLGIRGELFKQKSAQSHSARRRAAARRNVMHTSTHTYAILKISQAAYDEIRAKLEAAGYADQFHEDDTKQLIDMHGIAVSPVETVRSNVVRIAN